MEQIKEDSLQGSSDFVKMENKNEQAVTALLQRSTSHPSLTIDNLPVESNSSSNISEVLAKCGKCTISVKLLVIMLAVVVINAVLAVALYESTTGLPCEAQNAWMSVITVILNMIGVAIITYFLTKKTKRKHHVYHLMPANVYRNKDHV